MAEEALAPVIISRQLLCVSDIAADLGRARYPADSFVTHGEWGAQVGVNYDPMIAKVIARGPDRQSALRKMYIALSELQVHTRPELSDAFCSGPAWGQDGLENL